MAKATLQQNTSKGMWYIKYPPRAKKANKYCYTLREAKFYLNQWNKNHTKSGDPSLYERTNESKIQTFTDQQNLIDKAMFDTEL